MTVNKKYKVTKRIKIHTLPLVEADVIQQGKFVKETAQSFVFDHFAVRKRLVIKIEKVEGNAE